MKNQNINDLIANLTGTNSYLSRISDSVYAISVDPWVMWGAIATVFLGVIAFYTANKEEIDKHLFKPKIKIDPHPLSFEQKSAFISRLTITNTKKAIAKNATYYVDKLWYYKNDNWVRAKNFLQFPLRWTHTNNDEHKNCTIQDLIT